MKNLILDHPYTPSELNVINQKLVDHLATDDPDEVLFLKLVTERDECIQDLLKKLSEQELKSFVEAEINVNGLLVAYSEKMFEASLKQLSGLVRGRKAVKKYA